MTCVLDIPASVLEGQLFVVGLVTCQAARLRRNIENIVVCFKKKKKLYCASSDAEILANMGREVFTTATCWLPSLLQTVQSFRADQCYRICNCGVDVG